MSTGNIKLIDQRFPDRVGSATGEVQVIGLGAGIVSMAFKNRAGFGIFCQDVGNLLQGKTVLRSNYRAVLVEENVF